MGKKNLLAVIGIIVILIIGIAAGIFLILRREQKSTASVPGGQATVSVSPQTGTHQVGETFAVNLNFNTAGVAISGLTVRLKYPYAGETPELSASNLTINPTLLSGGDWSCPVKKIETGTTEVTLDISCVNFSTNGFISNQDTLLATFDLKVNKTPATNPALLSFDAVKSVITRKVDGEDVLLTPSSIGTYTVSGTGGGLGGAGVSPTATATSTPKATAKTSTVSATPTSAPALPESGFSLPTVIGLAAGGLLLVFSLYLAL